MACGPRRFSSHSFGWRYSARHRQSAATAALTSALPLSPDCHRPVANTGDVLFLSVDSAPPMARRFIEPIAFILLEFIVMTAIRTLIASTLFASAALAASAQPQPTAGASMPIGDAMMSHDCAKPMAKHDHGAEKNS